MCTRIQRTDFSTQAGRDKVLSFFRGEGYQILVATNVASRAHGDVHPPTTSVFYEGHLKSAVDLFKQQRQQSFWKARCAAFCARNHSFVRARRGVLELSDLPRSFLGKGADLTPLA